jgi:hypothetical protein
MGVLKSVLKMLGLRHRVLAPLAERGAGVEGTPDPAARRDPAASGLRATVRPEREGA